MLIGYVLKMYPRFSETFILNEILELERRGVKIHIYSLIKPDDGRFHARLAEVKAEVTYLPEYPRHQFGKVWPAVRRLLQRNPARFWKTFAYALLHPNGMGLKQFLRACVLADTLIKNPVDHLHAHFASSATSVAMLAHLFTGIPYSFTAHAKDIYLDGIDTGLLRDKLISARFVVTVSDYNRSHLGQVLGRGAPSRGLTWMQDGDALPRGGPSIRRLYNGIDLRRFAPSMHQADAGASTPLILSVGRLVEKKGFEDLVQACAILRKQGVNFTCEIIGKGGRESAIASMIDSLGLSQMVHLIGPRPHEAMAAYYGRTAVFALPCLVARDGNRDGTPTVLLEAMAMGIPVVSTRLTGIPELVDDGSTGLLVPERDPAALAEALARLLRQPSLREEMGRRARARTARDFDLQGNVAVLHSWFAGERATTWIDGARLAPASPEAILSEDPVSVR